MSSSHYFEAGDIALSPEGVLGLVTRSSHRWFDVHWAPNEHDLRTRQNREGSTIVLAPIQHRSRPERKQLGMTRITNRPTYGWNARCTCGWSKFSNEDKPYAEGLHRDHVLSIVEGRT